MTSQQCDELLPDGTRRTQDSYIDFFFWRHVELSACDHRRFFNLTGHWRPPPWLIFVRVPIAQVLPADPGRGPSNSHILAKAGSKCPKALVPPVPLRELTRASSLPDGLSKILLLPNSPPA